MTTNYLTIMMKHFEHMNIEVAAAAETVLDSASLKEREDTYDCNRFLFVKEGEGKLIVQEEEIALSKGRLCIVLSGMPHRISVEPDRQLTLQWCHFRSSYEDRDLYRALQIPLSIRLDDNHERETTVLFERLFELLTKDMLTSRLKIKATMLELISIYLDNLSIHDNDAPSEDLQKIDLVLKYIDDHLADNITVESLAKQVYLHPNYFIVFFKGILGYSPIQYVNLRRMEMAKGLLLQPECNVSAVASKVGMQIYYFSRMFKAHTGLTPSRYRKQATTMVSSGV
ncbi:AraC family transcriptional regulator [Cohnella cholangitidis]|uniref:AraC family transcriptional regulator n=1 Tax=Cohnella cholangitidis TaxID=2598458 RepID=A0A7G5BWT4_9BACL|nr:AraC family transcriptional regulator [Cohnella cholangitidis]QMV41418.1 AraC family transcriptional regulator [Cohnella cholangitidis]